MRKRHYRFLDVVSVCRHFQLIPQTMSGHIIRHGSCTPACSYFGPIYITLEATPLSCVHSMFFHFHPTHPSGQYLPWPRAVRTFYLLYFNIIPQPLEFIRNIIPRWSGRTGGKWRKSNFAAPVIGCSDPSTSNTQA